MLLTVLSLLTRIIIFYIFLTEPGVGASSEPPWLKQIYQLEVFYPLQDSERRRYTSWCCGFVKLKFRSRIKENAWHSIEAVSHLTDWLITVFKRPTILHFIGSDWSKYLSKLFFFYLTVPGLERFVPLKILREALKNL